MVFYLINYDMSKAIADRSPDMEDPFLVLIMGCIGLGLNIISIIFLHGTVSVFCAVILLLQDTVFADDGDVQNIMIIPVDILTVTHTASNMNM